MKKWLMADLHIHSTFSDRTVSVEEITRIYGENGFDVIAITDHLFDNQAPESQRLHEEGSGLGLPFVKEVVDLHEGRVLVHSEPQNGNTFSILFPVKSDPKSKKMEGEHEIQLTKGERKRDEV